MKTPVAKKQPHSLKKHGHERNDPYYWMNKKDSPEVLEYIDQENKFAENWLAPLHPLKNKLLKEYEERINPNEIHSEILINKNWFRSRFEKGLDYPIHEIKKDKTWTTFINENEQSKGADFYQLASWDNSNNNNYIAVSEDFIGRRQYETKVIDFSTKKLVEEPIKNTSGYTVWHADSRSFYYVKKDETTLREFQVYQHILGTPVESDQLIFEELDERYYVSIYASISLQYLFIEIESSTSSETLLIDFNDTKNSLISFLPRQKGHLYQIEHHTAGFYWLSNQKAKNNKLLFCTNIPTKDDQETEIIAHSNKRLIEDFVVLKNFIASLERENGTQTIRIIDLKTNEHSFVAMKETVYCLDFGHNSTFESDDLYYSYNSLTTPPSIFKYNYLTQKSEIHYQKTLLDKTFSPANYQSERIEATGMDGTMIPISLVYKKGIDLEKAPILVYGYGSYGITINPTFSAYRLSLINRGFVFAIAHIRGGKFLGENWYQTGKFKKKMNTFLDFNQCTRALIQQKYCAPDKVYAMGGSAGGLLMGACMNLAPYLYKGMVAQVPFVDVLTTMLDETIPLTVGEYEEWGNPNKKSFYNYLLQYSPYDNIQKTAYPSLYIATGYHDSQVQYWEPLKWVAKLRDYKTDNHPLIFECNMDAGHGGGSGRTKEREELAKIHCFLLSLEDISN